MSTILGHKIFKAVFALSLSWNSIRNCYDHLVSPGSNLGRVDFLAALEVS